MLEFDIGQGASSLDPQAWRDTLDGYAVASGLTPSAGSTGLEVDVESGTATVGETNGSVDTVTLGSADTVTLSTADANDPRKDTIYIDTAGTIQIEEGTPQAAEPSGETQFQTYVPEPPHPSTDGVILAEVWVGAGASSLSSADVRDRRVPADFVGDRVVSRSAVHESVDTGKTSITDDVIRAYGDGGETYQDLRISDYTDIMASVQAAHDNGSGEVKLPPHQGSWRDFSTTLTISDPGFTLQGTGKTRLRYQGSGDGIVVTGRRVGIRDIFLRNTGSSDAGIVLDGTTNTAIENCVTDNWSTHFEFANGAFSNNVYNHYSASGTDVFDMSSAGIGNAIRDAWIGGWSGWAAITGGSQTVFDNFNSGSDGNSPTGGIKIIGNASNWRIVSSNFENFTDGGGTPTGPGIQLGDSSAGEKWGSGFISASYRDASALVYADNGGSDNTAMATVHFPQLASGGGVIDASGLTSDGGIRFLGYNANWITGDSENRVTGETYVDADPVVRADDGSGKYEITVDNSGNVSTNSQ